MFVGWVTSGELGNHRSLSADPEAILAGLTQFHSPDRAGTLDLPNCCGVQTLTWNTPQSRHERTPMVCPESGNVLFSWLRLDNREELIQRLKVPDPDLMTDPGLVLACYRRWGVDCADQLEGDFSFALWDVLRQSLYLARDSVGAKPLFYTETDSFFGFATTVAAFQDFPAVDLTPDPIWLSRYLTHTSMSYTDTAFQKVKKLEPGHWLLVNQSGASKKHRYHQFVDDAPWSDHRDPEWVDKYGQVLEAAVGSRIRSSFPHGVETSGGLDSSTILGLILQLEPQQRETLQTIGRVSTDLEPEFILETSRYQRVVRNNILTGGQVNPLSAHRRGWAALGYPIEHYNATGHIPFYEIAQAAGLRTLHSGFGGDEVVTNRASQLTTEMLEHGEWRLALRELPGRRIVRPVRLAKAGWRHRHASDHSRSLLENTLLRLTSSVVRTDYLREADVSERLLADIGYGTHHRSINSSILEDWLAPLVPTRTEQCTVVAASYGLEYRWALLDRRLMQQYLSTPAIEKWGDGFGRYLHRRAVAGVVPDKVAWKPSKWMGTSSVTMPAKDNSDAEVPLPWEELHPTLQEIVDPEKWRTCLAGPTIDSTTNFRTRVVTEAQYPVRRVNEWLQDR